MAAITFDHVSINVSDFKRSLEFYLKSLAPMGITVAMEGDNWALIGDPRKGQFSIAAFGKVDGPTHIAFATDNRTQVREFYAAAIAAGGRDNGAPGLRPAYHPHYYGAFVLDPDGNNIEAVYHRKDDQSF